MKSYEETIRNVHHRIAVYETEQKAKRARIAGAAAAVTPVCLAAAVGVGLWKSGAFSPAEIRQTGEIPVTPVTETAVSVRSALLTTAPVSGTAAAPQTAAAPASGTSAAPQTAVSAGTESPELSAPETAPAGDSSADAAVTKKDEPQRTTPAVTAAQTAPATSATCSVTRAAVTETRPAQTDPAVGNGTCLREGDEPPVYRNLITSYPIGCSADYRAPYDGEVCYTVPLYYAMEEYDADADYMVIIEIYSGGGTKRLYELADLQAEFDRLGALGYEAGLNQPGNAAPFLTLRATYEELQNFPAAADRGYFLRLYMEDEPSCFPGEYNE